MCKVNRTKVENISFVIESKCFADVFLDILKTQQNKKKNKIKSNWIHMCFNGV